jgi:hypothetical protein
MAFIAPETSLVAEAVRSVRVLSAAVRLRTSSFVFLELVLFIGCHSKVAAITRPASASQNDPQIVRRTFKPSPVEAVIDLNRHGGFVVAVDFTLAPTVRHFCGSKRFCLRGAK